jgi:hypothetical protein
MENYLKNSSNNIKAKIYATKIKTTGSTVMIKNVSNSKACDKRELFLLFSYAWFNTSIVD